MKIVVFTLAAVVVALSVLVSIQLNEAGKTHDALCAFRNDLNARADATQKLLDDNPGKKLIDVDPDSSSVLLVSRSALVNSLHAQRQAVKSVDSSGIAC